jgi:membrane protein YdbS with pleckstrin-like domain
MNSAIQKHWYFITNERCINFAGFWGINKQIILFSNIVDVNVRQNPLETLLGLSSVTVDTPGLAVTGRRSRGSIIIAGLTAESAEKISHLIGEQMRNARKK